VIGAREGMEVMTSPKHENESEPEKENVCAHISCLCIAPDGEEYCGATCRDAESGDVEIACQCDHVAC